MNILSLDSPYSPFFSLVVKHINNVRSFRAIFSKSGYQHYFSGHECEYIGSILSQHRTFSASDMALVIRSNNHFSAYVRKFEKRELTADELNQFASFAHYFRQYLHEKSIDFVMMHNDLRWHHAIAREICLEEGVPFCVSELGLFRPYTMTLDFHGVNANSSITSLDIDFSQFADLPERSFDVPVPFHGHESMRSKLHFAYFLMLNKLGGWRGLNSPIAHNALNFAPYLNRFWQQNIKNRLGKGSKSSCGSDAVLSPYIFFPMQLEHDTQFLIHSDFSSNQALLNEVEGAFYRSTLTNSHRLVVKLHPNDLGTYQADERTLFTKGNTTALVNQAEAVVSVNSTVCMEALETDKPLFVLGRAFFARQDLCQPVRVSELSQALSNPNPVSRANRKGFLYYLKYHYSVQGAGFSFTENELHKLAREIESRVK